MVTKLCECGCGEIINKYNKWARERRFISGHQNRGRHHSKNTIEKIRASKIGSKHTIETKLKMKGRKAWNKGKIGVQKVSEATKEKKRQKRLERKEKLGYINSPETIEKIKKARAKQIFSNKDKKKMSESRIKFIKNHPETIEKYKKWRKTQILPVKDTSIEVKIQNFLSLLHIEFYTHKYISVINHSYQCDILIPEQKGINQKTIIEADGCYWHNCPICNLKNAKINKNDKIRTKELIEKGFRVIRLWEHDIRKMEVNDLRNKIYGNNY